jgi:prepilin-type processing-associated H-X9-DG protein
LKLIVSALLNYEKANRCFPPAYSLDDSGKPMHSWRVQVLPYMEQSTLYEAYDFKKPWDSPENKSVCQTLLPTYECPSESREVRMSAAPQTSYLAVVGPNTAWSGVKPRKLADFGNQASHTIMVVELADSGVEWAEPRDFSLDVLGIVGATPRAIPLSSNHRPRDGFFYTYGHASGVNVAMADGSMHFLRTDNLSPDELRKILEIGGCTDEVIRCQEGFYSGRHLNWPNIAALAVWLLSVGTLLVGAVRSRKRRAASLNSPVDR